MKINDKLSVLFLLEKPKMDKKGRAPIYVRITVEGSPRAEMSLGRKVYPEEWNQDDECVIVNAKNKELALVNTTIKQYRAKLETDYLVLVAQLPMVTSQLLKSYFLGESPEKGTEKGKAKSASLMEVVAFKLERQKERANKKLLAPATITKWNTTKSKLEEFIQHKYKADDIPLNEVNLTFADDLFHYFTVHDGLGENAAMKYISHLKQILKAAKGRWLESNPIEDFKCPYVQPDREALSMEQLVKLHKKTFINRLEEIKDVFLFCCFTGFAYKEVSRLTPDDIFIGNDGGKWVQIKRQKTFGKEGVPLLPIALAIVNKYKAHPICKETGQLLPVKSNVKYNAYLKEIADICNIRFNLTTHVARHTFATTVTLENDVPIESVSKMLGHKSIKTTQIYARITQKKVSNNMKALKSKLLKGDLSLKK
ncbi:MAG TPA: site-specific integrase [Pedobacter sp.]